MVAGVRLELTTFRVWTGCSSQLSYPAVSLVGRDDRIWTCDPLIPNQVHYQAVLRPVYIKNGAPSRNRTHNLLIRSQTLYPVELWARILLFLSTTLCYYNRVRVDLQQLFLFFHSLIFRIGGDDGTRTRTMFPSPDFKSDASTDSATSPILWRYLPDLNWRSQSCSLLPYHLAKVPFRCALLLYMNSY